MVAVVIPDISCCQTIFFGFLTTTTTTKTLYFAVTRFVLVQRVLWQMLLPTEVHLGINKN